jgi:hypothetical protein
LSRSEKEQLKFFKKEDHIAEKREVKEDWNLCFADRLLVQAKRRKTLESPYIDLIFIPPHSVQ